MSQFAKASFSAAGYAAARPAYPASLFQTVLAYRDGGARSSRGTLLDLGCGHGAIARAMGDDFDQVVGVDCSPGMLQQASSMTDAGANVTFGQGSAEHLPLLADGAVDMVVAGQAAHWFDYDKAWPELARVVRPGGTLAFWGYKDNVLVGHPRANAVLERFCYAAGEVAPGLEGMRAYWEQPGRARVRNLLRDVEPPPASWHDVRRLLYDTTEPPEAAWMCRRMRLGELEAYVRSFSAFQGWRDAHPQARSRAEQGAGDLADVLMDRIVETEPQWAAMGGGGWREAEVQTVWGTYVLMARRRTGGGDGGAS